MKLVQYFDPSNGSLAQQLQTIAQNSTAGTSGTTGGSALESGDGKESRNGNSWWNRVIDNAGGWINSIFGGVTGAIQAKTGNYPEYREDNTPAVLAIAAVAAIVLIVIILIIFKK